MKKEESEKKTETGMRCYAFPNKSTPGMPVEIDEIKCIGCNKCITICTMDVMVPNPEKGKPPIVLYPEECWRSGDCVEECPTGAIKLRFPLMMRVHYKDKETGEIRRV
jgi:NAD-dependent dihydropyrimidine dehydrogenase PreA subunit